MKKIAMIPARLGSQRLKQKNLRELGGIPLITRAIRKARDANIFEEIWVNSESDIICKIALQEGVRFHKRPAKLADDNATSEEYVYEFLQTHQCDYLFQLHSIAPLLTIKDIKAFVNYMIENDVDTLLSMVLEQIECAIEDKPINFSLQSKTNSQDLKPIQRITWSITGWKSENYLDNYEKDRCATYFGKVAFYAISREAGYIIKTEEDLKIAEALLPLIKL